MRKLLITKRLTALLWALVLTLMPMNLMADNTPLSVTVLEHVGSFDNEKAGNAFDGNPETKWCGGIRTQSNTNAFVRVRLAEKSKLDYYYLYTGNDINYENNDGKQQRNPKEWKLYAKVNLSDEWTLISHVTDAGLPTTVSTRSNNYKIDAAYQNIEYNYLKFEILQVEQGTIFEVGEICFINCNHTFGELIPAKEPTCTEAGNIAYHQCKECEKYFDLEGNELAEGAWVRPASHKLGELIAAKAPTCTEAGNIAYHQCTECNKYFDEEGNELAEGAWVRPAAHTFGSDDICTECGYKKLSLLSFTIEKTLGGYYFRDQGPDKAIDCITTNKWCGDFEKGNPYIILKNDGKAKLDHYYLYTGNDIFSGEHNRNPKEWKLYAKEKASDEWTVISDITDAQLPAEKSARSKDYTIEERLQETYYKFFKFEIIGVEEGDTYEVGELCLMGYPCHHQYDGESVFCSICGDIKKHEHILNDDLKCTVCGYEITADCIIEYTATERLSVIYDGVIYDYKYGDEAEFDYTDKDPHNDKYENWGEWLFGAPAIKHEYYEATGKGRIICNKPVTKFEYYTGIRRERLTSITLPSTVELLGLYPFDDCSNLTSITFLAEFSEELNYWGDFNGCNNLQEIIVPYNSYHKYVEAYDGYTYWYNDEDGVPLKDYLKSLLSLDDNKGFESPESEVKADATLQRSFADDGWYSLCLPFDVDATQTAEKFAQVAKFKELDGNTYRFTTVDNIEAGKPYIVKVDAAVANPTFKNVFITTEAPATDGDFIGVYSPTVLGAGCKVIGTGTTVNPAKQGTMKGFRAYFPASSAAGAKAMRFTVDDGEATDIQSLTEAEGYKLKAKGTYNLAGQKVNENYCGIVVRNGKKVLVK